MAEVFAWCTDYREDDADLSDVHLLGRRVFSHSASEVAMEDILVLGRPTPVRYRVSLHPPDRWRATGQSRYGGVESEYRLTPFPDGTRIDIEFDLRPRGPYRLLAPFVVRPMRRRLNRLWDDFVRQMEAGG